MDLKTVVPFTPHVHPIFQQLFDNLLSTQIQRVNRVLGSCCFDRCQANADLCDLETGCGYCLRHFREVDLAV